MHDDLVAYGKSKPPHRSSQQKYVISYDRRTLLPIMRSSDRGFDIVLMTKYNMYPASSKYV